MLFGEVIQGDLKSISQPSRMDDALICDCRYGQLSLCRHRVKRYLSECIVRN